MANEHIHELTWDYLHGLLERTETEGLRAHVEVCPECQAALAQAEAKQRLLARAARVVSAVPVFTAPGGDQEAPSPGVATANAAPATMLPAMAPPRRRSVLRRYWPAWAAAAALLAVACGFAIYQSERSRHDALIVKLRGEVETADNLFAVLQANVTKETRDVTRLVRERNAPQLNVLAPAQVQSGAPANIRVATRDLNGNPLAADITTSIVAPVNEQVLGKHTDRIQGEGTVQVPALKSAAQARLRVEAKAGKADARVEASLHVVEPAFASHLALDKSTYAIGDNLFFRTLTLDRFSLKPPARDLALRFTLVDAKGRVLREMPGRTGPGGISGGEWALENDIVSGTYTLQVAPAASSSNHVLPQQRSLEIVRNDDKLMRANPIVLSDRTIDFFPEGGELVAGLPNRVYFRVRSPHAETVETEGHVSVLANKMVLVDSTCRAGLGSFTFVPDPKETYSARIADSQGATEIPHPFQKLGILDQGMILHASQSVGREGESLPLSVRVLGPARRLLLETSCRGQIVDQQYLDAQPGSRTVMIPPMPGTAGILRVTALDASASPLVPLAERLLYRTPAQRLDVFCEIAQGPGPFKPGTHIAMNLKTVDEQRNPGPAWMLAAVVNENFRAEKNESSLAAHFYLADELGGEALDNANLFLKDTPASRDALDLFLGTHGWRRFVRGDTSSPLTLAHAERTQKAKGAAAADAFLSLQNATTQNLQDTYQAVLHQEMREVIDRANGARGALMAHREESAQKLSQAVRTLAEFEQLPTVYFRLGLGILTVALIVGSGVFLTVGLFRLVRGRAKSPTASFAGAFACLLACLALFAAVPFTNAPDEPATVALAAVQDAPWPPFTTDNVKIPAGTPPFVPAAPSPPLGYLVAQAATNAPQASASMSLRLGGALAMRNQPTMVQSNAVGVNQLQNAAPGAPQRQFQESKGNDEMQRRFAQNSFLAKEQARGPQAAFAKPAPGGVGGGGFAGDAAAGAALGANRKAAAEPSTWNYSYFREYAHRGSQQPGKLDLQDTLLWQPVIDSPSGEAQVSFDLAQNLTTYRILVYANSPSGRLGFYEGHLEVSPK